MPNFLAAATRSGPNEIAELVVSPIFVLYYNMIPPCMYLQHSLEIAVVVARKNVVGNYRAVGVL